MLIMAKKTPEQISYNMSRVKNKDSAIEVALRKELWSRGLRYRKNVKTVLGKPDIAFIGKKDRGLLRQRVLAWVQLGSKAR